MEAKLIVVGGEVKASEIKLKLPTIIGRGKGATLLLQHPLVSRQHCEIYEDSGRLVVRDMGSLNGTFVNNARLTEPTFLPSGDLLTIGDVTFRAEYFSDPNLKPPDGPKTARIGGLPTSQAIKAPKEPAVDFSHDDSAEDIDFGSVEVVEEEETPQVHSLDEIPAMSSSDADFDPLSFLEDEEDAKPAKPAAASKMPAKQPEVKATSGKAPEPKKSEPKQQEAKSPAKATTPTPAKSGSSGGTAKTGGAPGSRWVVPGSENNETLRVPNKPKTPPAPKGEALTPAEVKPAKPSKAPQIEAPEPKAKAKDEAADFLAALGMDDAPAPKASQKAAPSDGETEDFLSNLGLETAASDSIANIDVDQIEEVEDIADVEDVAESPLSERAAVEPTRESITESVADFDAIDVADVEEIAEVEDVAVDNFPDDIAITPPTPAAEAASAMTPPPTIAETPSLPASEAKAAADDDIAAFLSDLAAEPVTSGTDDADEVEEIVDIEAVEDIEVEEVSAPEEIAPAVEVPSFKAAEPAPIVPPAPQPIPAAPAKRPHAAPVPFAMPYAPPKPAAAVNASTPSPPAAAPAPARRAHAAPRAVPGPAITPPTGRPGAPTSQTPAPTAQKADDEGLSDFLKNLGK